MDRLRLRLRQTGYERDAEFSPNLDRTEKQAFLRGLTLFSVPASGEAFGLYLLEAMASGVPVVQPATGAFSEIVEATGGGLLCKPDDPLALAIAFEGALSNRIQLAELGRGGMAVVRAQFNSAAMARAFAGVCEEAIRGTRQGTFKK